MFHIFNKNTGEKVFCEDKEQVSLMLSNPNFVRRLEEVKKQDKQESVEEVKTSSNRGGRTKARATANPK